MRAAIVAFALLALTGPARASGFLIYDASAEALGKASAVTASTNEPAAVWFNPGALGFMKGGGASVGGNLVLATNTFQPKDGGPEAKAKPARFFLPAIFAEGAVSDRLHLGIAALTAFGLGIHWPQDWVGREATIEASVQTFGINPTAGYRLTDRIGIGAGFQAVRATVDFTNALPAIVGGTVRVGGGTWGYGGNVALMVKVIPETLQLGLTYRSRVKLKFKGRADFDPNPEFASSLPDQGGKADLTLPDIITAGVMWRPTPRLALSFDPDVALWATYDRLVLDFDTAPDKIFERRFHAALTARLGADWTSSVPGLNLRGGLIYDQNPSPKDTLAPSLPDAHRLEAAVGIGYRRGWLKADLAYLFVYFLPSESTGGTEGPIGTYRTISHLIGITVGAQFGR
ncbi:MAG TPA: outer membrane protein transport protein [Polyangia bacterium]|nr:outer membrane protein transport protein [Polyangia bacterium]